MKFYQELTQWQGNTPNHVYLLNDDRSRAIGYVKHDTDDLIVFKKSVTFSTKNRKFKEVKNSWGYAEPVVRVQD
jgi:hypothetical protein